MENRGLGVISENEELFIVLCCEPIGHAGFFLIHEITHKVTWVPPNYKAEN